MHIRVRQLLILGSGAAVLATAGGLTSAMSAAPSSSGTQATLDWTTPTPTTAPTPVNDASVTTGPIPTTCAGPVVNANDTITFCITAPGASSVQLNFQNMLGAAPAADAFPMTETATGGIWYITVEPPAGPNWYGYNFTVDGAQVADPDNRNISVSVNGSWSMVLVPGPGTEYMAETDVPHGAVATVDYYSSYAKAEREMTVYTPPGYNSSNRAYPVLYLLHGHGGNDTDWIADIQANFVLDNLIAEGKAKPMIVVMPDTNVVPALPLPLTSVTEDAFVQDELMPTIVPYIQANYRVLPGAQNRAIAGLSMGSNHTRDALFLDPDQFAYYGLFSYGLMDQTLDTDLVQNHPQLVSNVLKAEKSKAIKLVWISAGGEEIAGLVSFPPGIPSVQQTLSGFSQLGVQYTFDPGPSFGAIYGHVWDTWRLDLLQFAPLLFH